MKKILSVRVREPVYHDGQKTISAKACTRCEFHPAGVQLAMKDRAHIIIPFSNILWIEVDESGK